MKQKTKLVQTANGTNYLVPFVLITTLFFLWGFAHSILDVLNKHFQDALSISKTHSALIQAVVYGGYFLMAMPAGEIIRRYGYRTGVITGLILPDWSYYRTDIVRNRCLTVYSRRANHVFPFFPIFSIRNRMWTDLSGNCRQSLCYRTWRKRIGRTAH